MFNRDSKINFSISFVPSSLNAGYHVPWHWNFFFYNGMLNNFWNKWLNHYFVSSLIDIVTSFKKYLLVIRWIRSFTNESQPQKFSIQAAFNFSSPKIFLFRTTSFRIFLSQQILLCHRESSFSTFIKSNHRKEGIMEMKIVFPELASNPSVRSQKVLGEEEKYSREICCENIDTISCANNP